MHFHLAAWTAVCLSISTVSAFYPYHFPEDSDGNTRVRRTLIDPHRSASETDGSGIIRRVPSSSPDTVPESLTLPIRRVTSPFRRQNTYSIVNSNDPQQKNSVAVDQDGQDISYMVAVTIGDSKEKYHLLLDSAASNTWVMAEDCTTDACKKHNTFGKGDSKTLNTQTTSFSITYGTGSVSGTLASDTVHIGGTLSPNLTFGLATNVSQDFLTYPMDGILGIGRGESSSGTASTPRLLDVLKSSNLISAKLYGIHLSRGSSGAKDGELNIGEPNKGRYDGDLNYIKTIDNSNGFWEIAIDDVSVGDGKPLGLTGRSAIVDTGTSFILVPENDAVALHAPIPGYKQNGETFTVPCDTKQVLRFAFNKQTYNISTADWVGSRMSDGSCRSNIVGRQTFGDKQWLVGDTFLKNVYSVYDMDNSRVGLGVKGASGTAVQSGTASAASASAAATGTSSPTAGAQATSASVSGTTKPSGQGSGSGSGSTGTGALATTTSSLALSVALGLVAFFV